MPLLGSRASSIFSGYAVTLSYDGTQLAVGAPQANYGRGSTYLFHYDQTTGLYLQVLDRACTVGASGSLSEDGFWLAMGDPFYKGASGATWIFRRDIDGYHQYGFGLSFTSMPFGSLQEGMISLLPLQKQS